MGVLEALVEYVRDTIARPNVGRKWVNTWTPLLLTFFVFIFCANAIGLIPLFDVIGLLDHLVLHTSEGSFVKQVMHGGTTATANFNVTAALASITFGAIIIAGSRAHGAVQHWKNIVPHGLAWPLYILLIPIEVMGMFVKPFALTMRLAANMTGGHIAILAILSFVFLFTRAVRSGDRRHRRRPGGLGAARGRHLGTRNHRRARAGVRVHAVVGRVHRHGHQRSSLEFQLTEGLSMGVLHYFGAAIGLGMIVIGAALGIGKFAAAAAEGIARQPGAADKITGAINLPLFLLEGVAILAEVFVLLVVLLNSDVAALTRRAPLLGDPKGPSLMNNPLVQPDPGLFIWTILTFLVLLTLLAKFAWGPLLQALEGRQKVIEKALEDAAQAKTRARAPAPGVGSDHRQGPSGSRRDHHQEPQ